MKRWAIARMVVDGDGNNVPAVNRYPCNWRIIHKGVPTWVLCQISAGNIAQIDADPDIKVFPDTTLDMRVSDLSATVRTALTTRLTAAGFDAVVELHRSAVG